MPHATEQLGPGATTTEPAPRNGRGRDSERPAHRDEERSAHRDEERSADRDEERSRTAMKSGPRLPQLEKALARTEDPTQPKINK